MESIGTLSMYERLGKTRTVGIDFHVELNDNTWYVQYPACFLTLSSVRFYSYIVELQMCHSRFPQYCYSVSQDKTGGTTSRCLF
jgi:hypothetical protein